MSNQENYQFILLEEMLEILIDTDPAIQDQFKDWVNASLDELTPDEHEQFRMGFGLRKESAIQLVSGKTAPGYRVNLMGMTQKDIKTGASDKMKMFQCCLLIDKDDQIIEFVEVIKPN